MATQDRQSHDDNDHHQDSGGSPPRDKRRFNDPGALARSFLKTSGKDWKGRITIHYWRGEWWFYSDGRYRPKPEAELRGLVVTFIEREFDRRKACDSQGFRLRVSKNLVSNVIESLQGLTQVDGSIEQPVGLGSLERDATYIAFQNGLLKLNEELDPAFCERTPEWFSPNCLPFDYKDDATCPSWRQFLKEIFPNDSDTVNLVQEMFGYLLTSDTRQQRFFVFTGNGANGKSVLLAILRELLGPDNVAHQSLSALAGEFGLAPLVGKLANISAEMESRGFDEEMVKKLVGGDPVTVNRKHRDQRTYKLVARLVFATNNLPRFSDRSQGMWRRSIIIPCPVTIPLEKQDLQLPERLRQELPGIFNWAVEGLRRLRARGLFTLPAVSVAALKEHQRDSNPARVFLTEHYEVVPGERVPKKAIYARYRDWCREVGVEPLDASAFGHEVRTAFPTVRDGKLPANALGRRDHAYVGIRWVQEDVAAPSQQFSGAARTATASDVIKLAESGASSAGAQNPRMPSLTLNRAAALDAGLRPKAQALLDAAIEALDRAERAGLAPVVELGE